MSSSVGRCVVVENADGVVVVKLSGCKQTKALAQMISREYRES